MKATLRHIYLCRTANMSWRTCVVVKQIQSNPTQLSKRMPNNSTIFAAEATDITLALNYYQHMGPVYSNSMSCLQAIEGENTENPFICHNMNLLWLLSDKGTRVGFCWIASQYGIEGNERVDQLAKDTLDHDIDPLASVHYNIWSCWSTPTSSSWLKPSGV